MVIPDDDYNKVAVLNLDETTTLEPLVHDVNQSMEMNAMPLIISGVAVVFMALIAGCYLCVETCHKPKPVKTTFL